MNCLANSYINEIVSRAKFNNAFGIINLFRGFACFLGPYIAANVQKAFDDSHEAAFYYGGGCFAMGALMSLVVGVITALKKDKNSKGKPTEAEMSKLNEANKA